MHAGRLRPVQIWVPDVRSPQFATEANRQSAFVASSTPLPCTAGSPGTQVAQLGRGRRPLFREASLLTWGR
ncbi:MAG TPA: antitoxin MazE-like protein [Acidimicrobiales bacterium]|nr:antitoxin MazE-like protein [Acidimicrobiales bacterium]